MDDRLTSIELFAGAGGLLLGASLAGFRHLAAVEWDHNCCETLRLNQKRGALIDRGMRIIEGDVRDVDWSFVDGEVDLLAGGPPCQPFSFGGNSRAHADSRDMFPAYAAVLAKLRPRAFICENVKGIARRSFERYYGYILSRLAHPSLERRPDETWESHFERLSSIGAGDSAGLRYDVVPMIVDAADYGVPQRRHRVIIVGFRSDVACDWRFPRPTHSRSGADGLARWRTLGEAIDDAPDLNNDPCGGEPKAYPGHTGSAPDEPCKAIKAGVHGVPGGKNMIRYDDGGLRYLTVREAARVQTFPDDYEFSGSWGEGMRQIGNAVPVMLAEAVAKSVAGALARDSRERIVSPRAAFSETEEAL